MRRTFLKICQNFPLFALNGPLRGQPLDLNESESPFPKNSSYKIWLKSDEWFWRSRLKEKLMPGELIISSLFYKICTFHPLLIFMQEIITLLSFLVCYLQ